MQVSSQSASAISRICVRVSKAEITAGIPAVVVPEHQTFSTRQGPADKINKLCGRISRLEKKLDIKGKKDYKYISLGPSGNALLSNKINMLCARLVTIERKLALVPVA